MRDPEAPYTDPQMFKVPPGHYESNELFINTLNTLLSKYEGIKHILNIKKN